MRRYLEPRLLGLHLGAVIAIVASIALANWQWERAHGQNVPAVSNASFAKLSPLRDYLPRSSIGVKTTVTGTWLPKAQIIAQARPQDGRKLINTNPDEPKRGIDYELGRWFVDVLKLDDGSVIGVVRGWRAGSQLVKPATGRATVTGYLQPSEDSPDVEIFIKSTGGDVPLALTTTQVVERAGTTAHDGYLVQAKASPGLKPVIPIYSSAIKINLQWQNVLYTFNWIVFAIIICCMWIRVVRDETEENISTPDVAQ